MPNGIPVLKFVKYRLSRVYSTGVDYITYNRVILFTDEFVSVGTEFVEGFKAKEFIMECAGGTHSFRRTNQSPLMLFEFDKFRVIGSERVLPQLRSKLSLTPGPMSLKVNWESEVFSVKLRDVDASPGEPVEAFNSTSLGTNTDVEFYDRDVRSVGGQRNILGARARLTPTPPPEKIAGPLMESIR